MNGRNVVMVKNVQGGVVFVNPNADVPLAAAPNFTPKSISAGAEPVVTIRAFAKRIVTLLLVRPLVGLLPATHE